MTKVNKPLFIPLLFFLVILFSCGEACEENLPTVEEELFFNSFGEDGSEELLLRAADGMVEPWSGLALYELSRSYLERPIPPSLGKINRLWKKYVNRFGFDEYSRSMRCKISLLAHHDPLSSPLLDESEAGEWYPLLYDLKKSDVENFGPFYDFLDRVTDEGELSFLFYYLGSCGLLDDIPRPLSEWLTLKLLVAEGEYRSAWNKISELETQAAVTSRAGYYRDTWKVVLSHPDRAAILDEWAQRNIPDDSEGQWSVLFYSALCRRSMKHYLTSGALLEKALDRAVTSYQYDRTLWYRLDVLDKSGGDLTGELMKRASLWHDPAYFDDLVDRAVSSSVFDASWERILALEDVMGQWGSPDSRDLTAWTVAQCGTAGYVALPEGEEERLYEEIIQRHRGSLYTILAEYTTTGTVGYYEGLSRGGVASDEQEDTPFSLVFHGLIERNIVDAAREWYVSYGPELSLDSLRSYSYLLRRNGDYLESIRVMGKAGKREDFVRSREDLTLLYPLEYAGSIEYWCGEFAIPETLFRALIKTESGYDKDIISYAGAVGLSQLMPPTAEERMELMGMEGSDLTDPDVNIALGTGYLRWLYDREYIETSVQATAAYNGGPGSVRKWNRTMGNYPSLLYMEGIPFTQTRDYVKSLVQGAVVYGFLYENRPPEEILGDLLPELAG